MMTKTGLWGMQHIVVSVGTFEFSRSPFKKFNFADTDSKRPLAGFTVINEHYIDYNTTDYKNDVSTLVHEIMHAMFFDPVLFENDYPMYNGNPFYFVDNNTPKIQGAATLDVLRSHFNCPTADGSKFLTSYFFYILFYLN